MSSRHIVYVSHSDSTREAQASALANVYRLVLDSANRNAVAMTSTDGSDAMKGPKNDRARPIIQESE
jgi:hypothetical protein